MRTPDPHADIEAALRRLMPVPLSDGAQRGIEGMIDGLAGESKVVRFNFKKPLKWLGAAGLAAAVVLGGVASFSVTAPTTKDSGAFSDAAIELPPRLLFLAESDRVEGMSDEGLFVDAGGSALRKVRIRVVEESRVRDEETGIVVVLSEPREEMFLVPVSSF